MEDTPGTPPVVMSLGRRKMFHPIQYDIIAMKIVT